MLLICPTTHRPAISHYINSGASPFFPSLRVDIQTFDESQDASIGTCTLLRHFSSRIISDFVLLPCDFLPPQSLPLSKLLNKFRTDAIADGSIATTCWFQTHKPDKAISDEWSRLPSPTPIVWDESTKTILHIDTPDDIDRNSEDLQLRMSLLSRFAFTLPLPCGLLTKISSRYPRTKLSSSFQDSHVYVCRRSVLDVLHEKTHFDSFREEFIPWLCKIQYQRTRREKYGHGSFGFSKLRSLANNFPKS